jgi:hypothetical protein
MPMSQADPPNLFLAKVRELWSGGRVPPLSAVVTVHGPRVTSVQRGVESQAKAGLSSAVEWPKDKAIAESK